MTANAAPATYFQGPRPGAPWSTRGATRTAIIPATRNHEPDTSTSAPARVPSLMVPAGRGVGSGPAWGGLVGVDTKRAYATGGPGRARTGVAADDCRRAPLGCWA